MLLVRDSLRKADCGRVLRADSTRHWEGMRSAGIRVIKHDADIAPIRIAAREAHARAERVGQRHSEREQHGPRTVVAEHAVAVLQLKSEQHLRQVVAARAELIEDLLRGDELLLLDPVHFAAGEDQSCNLAPIHFGGYSPGVAIGHGQESIAPTTAAINRSIWRSAMPTTLKRPDS